MKFSEIPEVGGIGSPELYKFIVAEVISGDEKRLVARAAVFEMSDDKLSHIDIFYALCEEIGDAGKAKMLGGGWLDVEEDEINIDGSSHDYGAEPDRNSTFDMIQRAFPDRKIKVK